MRKSTNKSVIEVERPAIDHENGLIHIVVQRDNLLEY